MKKAISSPKLLLYTVIILVVIITGYSTFISYRTIIEKFQLSNQALGQRTQVLDDIIRQTETMFFSFISILVLLAMYISWSKYQEVKNEIRFLALTKATNDVVWDWNALTEDVWRNENLETVLGYTPEDLAQYKNDYHWWTKYIHPEDVENVVPSFDDAINQKKKLWAKEYRFRKKNGTYAYIYDRGHIIYDEAGKVKRVVGAMMDISDRKNYEEQLESSLHEKEILIKEIHHRVKNNMAIISSLLQLQSFKISDKEAIEAFENSQSRIKSMAMVHEHLYQSETLSNIEFRNYLLQLTSEMQNSYYNENIELSIDVPEPVSMDITKAIPCGLIVNELVANSFKHAFPNQRRGKIEVSFTKREDGYYQLAVRDNGTGLPDGFTFGQSNSLGLVLVQGLIEQLEATYEIQGNNGTVISITFIS
jgi:PAS domain S-box-containing protein